MKKNYNSKNGLTKNVFKGLIILIVVFGNNTLKAQNDFTEVNFLGGANFFEQSASIKSLWYDSNPQEKGLLFTAENVELMKVNKNSVRILSSLYMEDGIWFDKNPGYLLGLENIFGTQNGLKIRGNVDIFGPSRTDIFIAADGKVGIGNGTITPNGALHVSGGDNTGINATLTIESPGQRMLLDGNEIDASQTDLFLQLNAESNVQIAGGGGNVGIGLFTGISTVPTEKLHVLGNLRVDDGIFLSNENMIFRSAMSGSANNNIIFQNNAEAEMMRINMDGNVGIGTSTPSQKLEVDGTIKATSFVSSASSFPDYVFDEDYKLLTLDKVDAFVKEHRHLPNMPSEKEVVENGLDMTDVVIKSVENIENIYLHLIQLNEKIEALEQENRQLKKLLNN
jgi:hypothetical protein